MSKINIQIDFERQWKWLDKQKKRGESFENVLERVIKLIKYDKLQKDLENLK